jgi:RNA polymerase primary sigma factor
MTREGEVELARQIERGETILLEALVDSGMDARAALLGDASAPDEEDASGEGAPAARLTPGRFEAAKRYVEQFEQASAEGLSQTERQNLLRPLVQRRELTRRLLAASPGLAVNRPDGRIRLGIALSDAGRDELIRANLGIVIRIARKYVGRGLSLHDLIQEGNIGLMRAIDKFDFRRGHRFVTYAAWWVRSTMTRALADTAREIRVPSYVVEMQRRLAAAKERLTEIRGDVPEDEELARYLDISEESVSRFSSIVKEPMSLDVSRDQGDDGNDRTLGSLLADTETPMPEEIVANNEMTVQVLRMLKRLKPREREMIRLRFGIGKKRDYTLQEVGSRFGLSRERVRQIERAVLGKLRQEYERAGDIPA